MASSFAQCPVGPLPSSQTVADGADQPVDVLHYTTQTCEFYPRDTLVVHAVTDEEHFIRSAIYKHRRQVYRMVPQCLPMCLQSSLGASPQCVRCVEGLYRDILWGGDEAMVDGDADIVPVVLTGDGPVLVLHGPAACLLRPDRRRGSGSSGVGKSHLAQLLARIPQGIETPFEGHMRDDVLVYETDSAPHIPDRIDADIVVIGNNHGYTLADVFERVTRPHCVGQVG
jgi:hypothetical protein